MSRRTDSPLFDLYRSAYVPLWLTHDHDHHEVPHQAGEEVVTRRPRSARLVAVVAAIVVVGAILAVIPPGLTP